MSKSTILANFLIYAIFDVELFTNFNKILSTLIDPLIALLNDFTNLKIFDNLIVKNEFSRTELI